MIIQYRRGLISDCPIALIFPFGKEPDHKDVYIFVYGAEDYIHVHFDNEHGYQKGIFTLEQIKLITEAMALVPAIKDRLVNHANELNYEEY